MNEDQIQTFINACKNAGFEVGAGKHKATINFGSNGFVSIQTMWNGELEVEYGLYAYEENSTDEWKEAIASYLMKAMKIHLPGITLRGLANCDKWEVSDIGVQISLAEKFEDAIFEAFCEVYK